MEKSKVVFKENNIERSKVVWGQTKDQGDFLEVTTDDGTKFTINKRHIVYIKQGGY